MYKGGNAKERYCMKKLLQVIGVVLIFFAITVPPIKANDFPTKTEKPFVYFSWCRQDALYWGAIVGEDMQVRIAIGYYDANNGKGAVLHAQPEVKILEHWYFFKMTPYMDKDTKQKELKLVIISMPKKKGHSWNKEYHMTWMEFALVQNTWMEQKDGGTLEYGAKRKAWVKKMNAIIRILHNQIPADIVP
jgi:hypothetical protein